MNVEGTKSQLPNAHPNNILPSYRDENVQPKFLSSNVK